MNFNISNSMNSVPFLTLKSENKLSEGQIWFLLISTALKQSLAIYELQWKVQQNHPNGSNPSPDTSGSISGSYLANSKVVDEKHSNLFQQNKKSIEKISYNSEILKNDKQEQKCDIKQIIAQDKNCYDEHKQLRTACQYPQRKRQKIIHQNQVKQIPNSRIKSVEDGSLIDLYQPAYLPKYNFSNKEIQQKREKLLLRRVLNWKQIDKRVGFRKMELKKLLG